MFPPAEPLGAAYINAGEMRETRDTTRLKMGTLDIVASTLLAWSALLVFLYVRGRGGSLRFLKGPKPSTFWLGTPRFSVSCGYEADLAVTR